MHFAELTQIGDHYVNEEGTGGVRQACLDGIAARLRNLRISLEAAKARTEQQVGTGTVRERAAFFQGGTDVAARAAAERHVKELQNKIEAEQAKLERQGAVLRPDGTIDWGLTSRQVVYDHGAQAQGLTRLHPYNGLLYQDGNHTTKFDTSSLVTAFGGRGWAIYVMSEEGNIHACSHSVGHRHHSSLLAGANVAGAGEMRVLQGKLVHITNKSGHYAPAAAHLLQVLYVLRKRGVSLFSTRVSFKTANAQQDFGSVDAFLADLTANGIEADYEYAKLLAYLNTIPYATFDPLARAHGWRWVDPAEIAAGKRGVVRLADGAPVSHRDVRKWLKSLGHSLGGNVPQKVQGGWGR